MKKQFLGAVAAGALMFGVAQAPAEANEFISIGTGGVTGVY